MLAGWIVLTTGGWTGVVRFGEACAGEQEVSPLLKTFMEEFVAIEPGKGEFPSEFPFGPEEKDGVEAKERRVVKIAGPFKIAKYEVVQNLYEEVMGANPSRWKGPRNSVEMMSAAEAEAFCAKLTERLREAKLIAAGEAVRLPTEIEWEYCCRAGTKTAYSFGDAATKDGDAGNKASILDEYGWHTGNAAGNDPPVGAKKPNQWGLYDMHGYLWEFATLSGSDDAKAKVAVRGGSWKDRHPELMSASRKVVARDLKDDAVGFRCVLAKSEASGAK
jgi:formylglycine-generating enzyme required for sulfatase activity